ncbi:MAG TPA: alpha/beta hydrolase [Rhizomicrobium sp.]|nr:alpha/beta hydrolase [Rhizomicrobium sp.]
MTLKNLGLGLLLAATLIAPSFAHADTTATRDRFSDQIVGAGPDLVFIPGLASSRDTWKATAQRLTAHYRLHLIQLAGFAGEPARSNATGDVVVPAAEAIDAYLVEQHLTPAIVIGHSLGGTIALYLAEHHGDHLKKAMLVDTLPFFGTLMGGPTATAESMKPKADLVRAAKEPMSPAQYDQMLKSMATAPGDIATIRIWGAASDKTVVARAMADDMTLDLRPDLAEITTPVTLLHPDYGALGTPPGMMDQMYKAAYAASPGVKVVEIAPSLHFIMLDQPAKFDAALDAFLAG